MAKLRYEPEKFCLHLESGQIHVHALSGKFQVNKSVNHELFLTIIHRLNPNMFTFDLYYQRTAENIPIFLHSFCVSWATC